MSRGLRFAAVLAALVVCAWFGLGAAESHSIATATGIVSASAHPTSGALAKASAALDGADFLNPDQQVAILRGQIALERGQLPLARRLLIAVARREPQNLQAWRWFTGAALNDPVAVRLGALRLSQLDPLDAKPLPR